MVDLKTSSNKKEKEKKIKSHQAKQKYKNIKQNMNAGKRDPDEKPTLSGLNYIHSPKYPTYQRIYRVPKEFRAPGLRP